MATCINNPQECWINTVHVATQVGLQHESLPAGAGVLARPPWGSEVQGSPKWNRSPEKLSVIRSNMQFLT